MSGKRILDAIALLRATRNVAYNHFAIRLSQAELYTKTSSITKALSQRYPLTSSIIAQRFSQSSFRQNDHIPQADKQAGPRVHAEQEEGIQQDHHYKRSEQNSTSTPAAESDIEVEQAKAERHPLPDGTIPPVDADIEGNSGDPESYSQRPTSDSSQHPVDQPSEGSLSPAASGESTIPDPIVPPLSPHQARVVQRQSEDPIPATAAEPPNGESDGFSVEQEQDVFDQPPGQSKPVLSALPRVRVPKTENDVQGGDSHIPKDINADVYYSGAEAANQEPTEEQLAQLFHTPRAAKLAGKKDKYMPGGARSFSTTSRQHQQQNAEAEKQELKQLAQEMAKDVSTILRMSDSS